MNAITPLVFEENLVRSVMHGGSPWFVGKDVCQVLDISKYHQALERLDADERGTYNVGTPGGEQTVIIVSEAGVYRLIFTSRKPSAERFKRWLAHEVLPALRKTGRFAMEGAAPATASPYDITAEAVPVLQTKLAMVREARHLFGHERARSLWHSLKLGDMPMDFQQGLAEANDVLQTLLFGRHEGETLEKLLERALEGDDKAAASLKLAGLWAEPRQDGFVVANRHPVLERLVQGTRWEGAKWQWVLRRMAGARVVSARRFGPHIARGVFLPCKVLDFGEQDASDNFERPLH